jgi:RHH-type proline utilization regulon transcriptional repressor/proline dehydrogenase/delta 1-pyrroline-5-carboxylate dehydrogenase
MRERGHRVHQLALPASTHKGCVVPATIIEIERIEQIGGEVFGPVLHVLRYRRSELDALLAAIEATGYGLTMGVHSRIEEHIERIATRCRVGNLYVNRNIVGAVVGVQPFGGEGLSGTGPKAGGPLYLARLGGPLGRELAARVAIDDSRGQAPSAGFRAAIRASPSLDPAQKPRLDALFLSVAAIPVQARRLELAGPTGETNELWFAPRGRIACLGGTMSDLLAQMIAALACGCEPIGDAQRLAAEFRPWLASSSDDASLDAALVAGNASERIDLQSGLARGAARIVPVIAWSLSEHSLVDLWRLFHERSISTNTAAAGGNASLMALAE